jgi:hypothetical protein
MQELVPVAIGLLVAVVRHRFASRLVRPLSLVSLTIIGAVLASALNREAAAWPVALIVDLTLAGAGVLLGHLAGAAPIAGRVTSACATTKSTHRITKFVPGLRFRVLAALRGNVRITGSSCAIRGVSARS